MKWSRLLGAAFLSSILIFVSTIGTVGSAAALQIIVPATTADITSPAMLRG
jgi:hypothetical protein